MPRGEPTTPRHLTKRQAATLGKPKAGQYRLTVAELAKLQGESVAESQTVADIPEDVTLAGAALIHLTRPTPLKPLKKGQLNRWDDIEVVPESSIPEFDESANIPLAPPPSEHRMVLRARLDALKAEYVAAQRQQDWDTCTRVNLDREPLFEELWGLERGLAVGDRYWFPVRFAGVAVPK